MPVPSLSESRFLSGNQWNLKLWYHSYVRDPAVHPLKPVHLS